MIASLISSSCCVVSVMYYKSLSIVRGDKSLDTQFQEVLAYKSYEFMTTG